MGLPDIRNESSSGVTNAAQWRSLHGFAFCSGAVSVGASAYVRF